MSSAPDVEKGRHLAQATRARSRGRDAPGMSVDQSRARSGDRLTQAQTRPAPEQEPEERRMIGDFDGSASEFWKLFRDEAKSHDDARIDTLKEGMESALIFAGLFSAVVTAFLVDSKQNLKSNPADEMVYYLQQHSVILSQISVQLSSIAPEVAISSTPPPPFPRFSPLASDVRVNIFWFMALAFSLLAALLAILVQQWVRNYMRVFQRYTDPLKSARLRQYLYEGCEKWKMPEAAEVVPGFLHVSLFLFFAGLINSLLHINTKVALSTIVPIGVGGLLYIFTIFAPIIYPQSPYKNLFSGILWYLAQKLRWRRFRDRGSDGKKKSVNANMAEGQMDLAMEQAEARKSRDERAIRWLIDNLTEDSEMEKFLSVIPGSFNTDWGMEVWKRVGEHHDSEDQSQDEPVAEAHEDTTAHQSPSRSIRSVLRPIIHLVRKPTTTAYIRREDHVYKLSERVARSVRVCKNRNLFANNDGQWRVRTRGCIEATASLVCCANAELSWFGGISKLLGDIGSVDKIRKLSSGGTDELFVMRWTCLSLVAIRSILVDNEDLQHRTKRAMEWFAEKDDTGNKDALAAAQKINETLEKASECLYRLYDSLRETEDLTDKVKEILPGRESQISELEQINDEADRLEWVDIGISNIQSCINDNTHQIISQIPGVLDDFDRYDGAPIPFSRFVELSQNPRKLQFIRPGQTLKSMRFPALTLRDILEGPGNANAYKELLKNLENPRFPSGWVQRQLCRMQDLRGGGGLGFTVELFFLAFSQLLSTCASKEAHSALYTGTFQTITSDWSKHKDCPETQKLLLDIATSRRYEFDEDYPAYIVDEFLLLLGNIFDGQTGPHIDRVRQEFEPFIMLGSRTFRERVLRALTGGQAGPTQSLAS